MPWVVDTCVIIDVLDGDPEFGTMSAALIDARYEDGLVLCPVSFIELSPAFLGDIARQQVFLSALGILSSEDWTWGDTIAAHQAWQTYVSRRRDGVSPKRPVADIQIGAFAQRFDGLLTRNPGDFTRVFPDLHILTPGS